MVFHLQRESIQNGRLKRVEPREGLMQQLLKQPILNQLLLEKKLNLFLQLDLLLYYRLNLISHQKLRPHRILIAHERVDREEQLTRYVDLISTLCGLRVLQVL